MQNDMATIIKSRNKADEKAEQFFFLIGIHSMQG